MLGRYVKVGFSTGYAHSFFGDRHRFWEPTAALPLSSSGPREGTHLGYKTPVAKRALGAAPVGTGRQATLPKEIEATPRLS